MKTAMDYEREERKAMIPPLCPVCHRRASERRGWASRPGYKSKHVRVLGHCLSPFHDAGDWGPALLEACKELRDALAAAMRGMNGTAIDRWLAAVNALGIPEGLGVRAQAIIAAVEGRK
jgi:hypothetical protein